jgi:TPR repeat protein
MGVVYYNGHGVPLDKAAALVWWRKAAEQGHAAAQMKVAEAAETERKEAKDAARFLEQSRQRVANAMAKKLEKEAERNTKQAKQAAETVRMDMKAAAERKKAVGAVKAEEDAEAHFYRGLAYRDGSGVERDEALALKWLLSAAETHIEAQVELGHMYYVGDGVAKCRAESSRWYAKAREGGSTDALMLGRVHFNRGEFTQSVEWFRKAAEQGSKHAQFHLGYAYWYGKGVPVDWAAGALLFQKAAEQGHAPAQHNLGYAYCHGAGVAVDYTKALGWYRKAAEQGHANATWFSQLAEQWAAKFERQRKAAELGDVEAQCFMAS